MWDFRFSRRWVWSLEPSGMYRRVVTLVRLYFDETTGAISKKNAIFNYMSTNWIWNNFLLHERKNEEGWDGVSCSAHGRNMNCIQNYNPGKTQRDRSRALGADGRLASWTTITCWKLTAPWGELLNTQLRRQRKAETKAYRGCEPVSLYLQNKLKPAHWKTICEWMDSRSSLGNLLLYICEVN
jgi:hypothetical protein